MIRGEECTDNTRWDEAIHAHEGHPLQLWGWGTLKSAHNWRATRVLFSDESGVFIGASQILYRQLPVHLGSIAYIPRGPVALEGREADVYTATVEYVKTHSNAIVVTVEPDTESGPSGKGWRLSHNTVLIPRTLILDLNNTEDTLMSAMAKKTRQYIRKSEKEGIEVRRVTAKADVEKCLAIYRQTAERAHFSLHGDDYYSDVHEKLGDSSLIFAAYADGNPVAFVWLAISKQTAFELYGGMNDQGQQLRANYALKWHAIKKCKEWGIERYDMNGLLNDGVSTFKQGFAAHENMLAGTYDYPLSPLYSVWTKGLPLIKKAVRTLNKLRK